MRTMLLSLLQPRQKVLARDRTLPDKYNILLIHPADSQERAEAFQNAINYVAKRCRVVVSADGQSHHYYLVLRRPYTTDLTSLYTALFGRKPEIKSIPGTFANFPASQPAFSESSRVEPPGEITRITLLNYGFREDQFREDRWSYRGISGWHSPLTNTFCFDQHRQETTTLASLDFIVSLIDYQAY